MRAEFIERLKVTNENPKELGKHWLDDFVKMFRDPNARQTTSGMKFVAEIGNFVLYGQKEPGRPPAYPVKPPGPPEEGPGDDKKNAIALPALENDPAVKVA